MGGWECWEGRRGALGAGGGAGQEGALGAGGGTLPGRLQLPVRLARRARHLPAGLARPRLLAARQRLPPPAAALGAGLCDWRWRRAAQPTGRRGRGQLSLVAGSAEPGLSWRDKVGGSGLGGGRRTDGHRGGACGAGMGRRGWVGRGRGLWGGGDIRSGGVGRGWGGRRAGRGGEGGGGGREPRGRGSPLLTGVVLPPADRTPPAAAMASSSPQHQSTIGFPRRRSARRIAASPPGKGGPDPGSSDPTALRLSPSPRAPGTHSARTKALPLSPCKRLGELRPLHPPLGPPRERGLWGGIPFPKAAVRLGPCPGGAGAGGRTQLRPVPCTAAFAASSGFGSKNCSRGAWGGAEARSLPPGRATPCYKQPLARTQAHRESVRVGPARSTAPLTRLLRR